MTTTALAAAPAKAPATTANPGVAKARKVAETLASIKNRYLGVYDEWERVIGPLDSIWASHERLWLPNLGAQQPESEDQREMLIARLEAACGEPSDADDSIWRLEEKTLDLVAARNEAQVRVLLGMMVDGYPNARPHSPETYLETLIAELIDKPPVVVAKAANTVVRSQAFLPSIAEVVQAAQKAEGFLRTGLRGMSDRADQKAHLKKVLDWTRTVPLLTSDYTTRQWGPGQPEALWRSRHY